MIASRNQVDKEELGGGYLSGWDQPGFVSGVKALDEIHAFPKAVCFCRDHGVPWQRDKELDQKIPHAEAMDFGKSSFLADLKAGFDLFHIDPTKNPFLKEHNTDYLDEETLKMHPVIGISSANVAPEFGVTETKSLLRLSCSAPSGEAATAAAGWARKAGIPVTLDLDLLNPALKKLVAKTDVVLGSETLNKQISSRP